MTTMKSALGATPRRRFRIPRFALMQANGVRSLRTSKAPWEKGLKTGSRRYTLSREKEETEATLPVEKKADCRRKRKKREMRVSERVRGR